MQLRGPTVIRRSWSEFKIVRAKKISFKISFGVSDKNLYLSSYSNYDEKLRLINILLKAASSDLFFKC